MGVIVQTAGHTPCLYPERLPPFNLPPLHTHIHTLKCAVLLQLQRVWSIKMLKEHIRAFIQLLIQTQLGSHMRGVLGALGLVPRVLNNRLCSLVS